MALAPAALQAENQRPSLAPSREYRWGWQRAMGGATLSPTMDTSRWSGPNHSRVTQARRVAGEVENRS